MVFIVYLYMYMSRYLELFIWDEWKCFIDQYVRKMKEKSLPLVHLQSWSYHATCLFIILGLKILTIIKQVHFFGTIGGNGWSVEAKRVYEPYF